MTGPVFPRPPHGAGRISKWERPRETARASGPVADAGGVAMHYTIEHLVSGDENIVVYYRQAVEH